MQGTHQNDISQWTVDHVRDWLINDVQLKKQECIEAFMRDEVDGQTLLECRNTFLNQDTLISEYKLTKLLDRHRFLEQLKKLLCIKEDTHALGVDVHSENAGNNEVAETQQLHAPVDVVTTSHDILSRTNFQHQRSSSSTGSFDEDAGFSNDRAQLETVNAKPLQEAFSCFEITRTKLKAFIPPMHDISDRIRSAERKYNSQTDHVFCDDKFVFAEKKYKEQLQQLMKNVTSEESSLLLNDVSVEKLNELMDGGVSIVVMGEVNAGKSAFINALLGKLILPSTPIPCTSTICRVRYSQQKMIKFYKLADELNQNLTTLDGVSPMSSPSSQISTPSPPATKRSGGSGENSVRKTGTGVLKHISNMVTSIALDSHQSDLPNLPKIRHSPSPPRTPTPSPPNHTSNDINSLNSNRDELIHICVEARLLDGYESVPEDWIQSEQRSGMNERVSPYSMVEVFWPLPLLEHGIEFVDTPGLNENSMFDRAVEQFLPNATAIILVIDLNGAVTQTLKTMLKKVKSILNQLSTNLFVVCTKSDLYEQEDLMRKKEYMFHELSIEFPKLKTHREDFFHSISSKNVIEHLKQQQQLQMSGATNNTLIPYPKEFIQLQQSLVKFICGTFEFKQDLMHDVLRKTLDNGLRYVKNTITTSKLKPVERQHLHNEISRSLYEIIESFNVWEKQCKNYIEDFKHMQLYSMLSEFWNSSDVKYDLTVYMEKLCNIYGNSANLNDISVHVKSHVCSLFLEFYTERLHSMLEAKKHRLLDFQINDQLREAITKLQKIRHLDIQDSSQRELHQTITDVTSVNFKAKYAHQFQHYFRMFAGDSFIEQVFKVPFVLPLTALITPIMISYGVIHYDSQVIESHVSSILKSQAERSRILAVVDACTEPLYRVVESVKASAYLQIYQELNLIQHSLSAAESNHNEQLVMEYLKCMKQFEDQLHKLIEFKETFINEKWAIDFTKVKWLGKINRGGMALVSKVQYEDEIFAMKQPLSSVQYEDLDENRKFALQMEFLNEVSVFAAASRGNHPNVVRFKGAHFSADGRSHLLIEHCPQKDLRTFLEKNRGKLSRGQRLDMLIQCATALEYLHAQGIIHRDVKPQNFLVQQIIQDPSAPKIYRVKVTDFGVSKSSLLVNSTYCGTKAYVAPELIPSYDSPQNEYSDLMAIHQRNAEIERMRNQEKEQRSINAIKCDIYSFAFIMYELWGERIPYKTECPFFDDAVRLNYMIAKQNLRPALDIPEFSTCPEAYLNLMQRCWDAQPANRPNDMSLVLQTLQSVYRKLELEGKL